jgi:hypothetical protein
MKMTVFWDVAPCSLVEIDQYFRGAYCLHHQGTHAGATSQETVTFIIDVGCKYVNWIELFQDRV